jgi:hypothetical protein
MSNAHILIQGLVVDDTNPLPGKAFAPAGNTVNLAVTTSTARVALTAPATAGGYQVRIYNAGSATAFIRFGTVAIDAATATSMPVPSGQTEVFTVASTVTHVAAITASGSATLYATTGYGE